jgi:agmatinase
VRFEQLAPLLRAVAMRQRIVGLDIVEIAPQFDQANAITAVTAGRLILNALGASWGANGAYRVGRPPAG